MVDLISQYQKPNAFKYGLKITSPFAEEFLKIVATGAEVIEIPAGEQYTLENELTSARHRLIVVLVGGGASFEYSEKANGERVVKNDIHVYLRGEGATAALSARYALEGASSLDVLHRVYHGASHTRSAISVRGALADTSYLIYRSGISMRRGERGLAGEEEGKFLMLSREAKLDAIPALDIAAREVASNHSLSISRIGEEDLFYPKTRGFSDEAARALILEGFLK